MRSIKLIFLILALIFVAAGCERKLTKPAEQTKPIQQTKSLHEAAFEGNIDEVKSLLSKGVDVNAKGWVLEQTALCWAAQAGHKDAVKLLIANNANINAKDKLGQSVFWLAKDRGHTEIVELLRKHGAKE